MKLQRILMLKMSGDDVRWMQTKLKEYGYHKDKIDGNFGQNTLISITNFQRDINIKPDGVVGPQTWSQILNYNKTKEVIIEQTPTKQIIDIPYNISYIGDDSLTIYDCFIDDDNYNKTETKKEEIWIHHSSGGSRPDWTIGSWNKNIGNQYVIGRKSSSTNDDLWDGKVLKAFDDRYWCYHIDVNKKRDDLNSKSIGIEICNYGPLTIGKDDRFYNHVNKPINDNDVVELKNPFRGYKYYEKYTDAQLNSTRKLIIYLQNRWGINIDKNIYNTDWFEYNPKFEGGLRINTQINKNKFDIFPQEEMIQMLNSI